MAKKLSASKIDDLIDQAYRLYGNNVQVNMMDIPKIFRAGREAIAKGENLQDAVKAAIALYRKN